MDSCFDIVFYNKDKEVEWNCFVNEISLNGTFLQTRNFLNYHPKERFDDFSLMFYNKKSQLVAVCPACITEENGDKTFYSHCGSTYGGLVISEKAANVETMLYLIDELEIFLSKHGFKKIILKPSMDLFYPSSAYLLEYCLWYRDYTENKEINTYINLSELSCDITEKYSDMKKRIIKKCNKSGMEYKNFSSENEISEFYGILCKNLEKYSTTPVHSLEELLELKYRRLRDNIQFYGCYMDNKMIAGTMVFEFPRFSCAHTQYLAADSDYNKLSPMSYVYYKTTELYAAKNYHFLSWGISTEDRGRKVNMGLTKNKESFGSKHNIVKIYEKNLIEV